MMVVVERVGCLAGAARQPKAALVRQGFRVEHEVITFASAVRAGKWFRETPSSV